METPIALVVACLTALPRLAAEESLRALLEVQLGTGRYADASEAKGIVAGWQRTAQPDARRRAVKARPEDLAAMGIGVHLIGTPA